MKPVSPSKRLCGSSARHLMAARLTGEVTLRLTVSKLVLAQFGVEVVHVLQWRSQSCAGRRAYRIRGNHFGHYGH